MVLRLYCSSQVILRFLYHTYRVSTANGSPCCVPAYRTSTRCSSTDTEVSARNRLNPTPDDYRSTNFTDKTTLMLYAGGGGNGCISFLREAYHSDGPPNGGDGGHGGNIYIQAVHGETSLHKLARKRFVCSGKGKSGQGSSKAGQRGKDVIISVPVGTIVRELDRSDPEAEAVFLKKCIYRKKKAFEAEKEVIDSEAFFSELEEADRDSWLLYPGISASEKKRIELPKLPHRDHLYAQPRAPIYLDLSRPSAQPYLLAVGGIGGLGNPHFASKELRKPLFATKGKPAITMRIDLELKLLADVGLVGLPNAGKSTLIRLLSNSQARVGNWAFTTLAPNVGTVVLDNNRGRPIVTSYHRPSALELDDPFTLEQETKLELRKHFTIADIPGLIQGAHLNKGIGIAFLRHVERAGVLVFVIDLSAGNAITALKSLWKEVGLYAKMREDEEQRREREAMIDYSAEAGTNDIASSSSPWGTILMADLPQPESRPTGLHIAAKPWYVIATKGDLPNTKENYIELRDYLARLTNGEELHPSGLEGAWIRDCQAIPLCLKSHHRSRH